MSIDPQRRALLRRIGGLSRRLRWSTASVVLLSPIGFVLRALLHGSRPVPGYALTALGIGLVFHHRARRVRTPSDVLHLAFWFSIAIGAVIASGLFWLGPDSSAPLANDRLEFPLLLLALALPAVAALLPTSIPRQGVIGLTWTAVLGSSLHFRQVGEARTSDAMVAMLVATIVSMFVVAIQNDQTRREAENRLRFRRANRERKQALRSRDELIANLSHDIRNPLGVATGYATMASDEELTPVERSQAMARLRTSLWQLASLVENVLVGSADEAGGLLLSRERLSVSELVEDSGESARILVRGRPIELRLDVEPDVEVIGDRQRLQRVLDNLIGNAVKYTSRGHIRLGVRREEPASAVIEVEDTGIGIAAEKLARVFDRFEQLGDARREGVGLGLAIARLLTERMGGQLAVRSRLHSGSCFVIRLPLAVRDPAKLAAQSVPHATATSAAPLSGGAAA